MTVFCEEIGIILQYVLNLFCSNHNRVESGLNQFLVVCNDLFLALAKLEKSILCDISYYLLKMLLPLLQQNSPFIISGILTNIIIVLVLLLCL